MTTSSPHASYALAAPRLIRPTPESDDALECSVHALPKPLMREFRHVFNDQFLKVSSGCDGHEKDLVVDTSDFTDLSLNVSKKSQLQLLAIPTNQRAREDLVAIGDHVEKEKDRLLNIFIDFGHDVCKRLQSAGYWADFIDPCSGLPMLTLDCNKVYSEVDGMECLLNYKSYNAGFCKILVHPKWGSAVYPATIFACCPVNVAKDIVSSFPAANSEKK